MTDDKKNRCPHCVTEVDGEEEYTYCPVDCLPVGGKFDARVYWQIKEDGHDSEKTTQAALCASLGASRQQVSRSIKKLLGKGLIDAQNLLYGRLSYTTEPATESRLRTSVDTKTVAQAVVREFLRLAEDEENLDSNGRLRVTNIADVFEDAVEQLAWVVDEELGANTPMIIYRTIHPIMRKADRLRTAWVKSGQVFHKVDGNGAPSHWLVNIPRLRKAQFADNEITRRL